MAIATIAAGARASATSGFVSNNTIIARMIPHADRGRADGEDAKMMAAMTMIASDTVSDSVSTAPCHPTTCDVVAMTNRPSEVTTAARASSRCDTAADNRVHDTIHAIELTAKTP